MFFSFIFFVKTCHTCVMFLLFHSTFISSTVAHGSCLLKEPSGGSGWHCMWFNLARYPFLVFHRANSWDTKFCCILLCWIDLSSHCKPGILKGSFMAKTKFYIRISLKTGQFMIWEFSRIYPKFFLTVTKFLFWTIKILFFSLLRIIMRLNVSSSFLIWFQWPLNHHFWFYMSHPPYIRSISKFSRIYPLIELP